MSSPIAEQEVLINEWRGLYRESWKGVIVDEAFAHPAKFSRALIQKIYEHVIEEGWASKGDSVVDPFGGVALGAFPAMQHGLVWYGVELEQKFQEMGQGSECEGFSVADWKRYQHRATRANYTHGLHWCPRCLREMSVGKSRVVPSARPHYYKGNIALWNERYSRMPNWGEARLLQGDSRKLSQVLRAAECCVSSPPYAGNEKSDYLMSDDGKTRRRDEKRGFKQGHGCFRGSEGAYGQSEGQLGAMREGDHCLAVASPPFLEGRTSNRNQSNVIEDRSVGSGYEHRTSAYGDVDGQLAGMKEGDHALAVSSPPYAGSLANAKNYADPEKAKRDSEREFMQHRSATYSDMRYGETEGNLGAMPEGNLCVTSPPYNPPMSQDHNGSRGGQRGTTPSEKGAFVKYGKTEGQLEGLSMEGFAASVSSPPFSHPDTRDRSPVNGDKAIASFMNRAYTVDRQGQDENNLAGLAGETFWSASRLILEQLHQVIVPGGHAVFVVKAFVRDKKIVDFPAQWAQLCEAVGFRLLHDHHALLTEHYGTQGGFESDKRLSVERKSFFRRLAEQKGSPRIDHENVLCFERT